jgi:hypothetical protein
VGENAAPVAVQKCCDKAKAFAPDIDPIPEDGRYTLFR